MLSILDTGIVPSYQPIMADLIDLMLTEKSTVEGAAAHRDTLAALVGGGQTKYLDVGMTSTKIEDATDAEIEMLFTRYELKLGAALTKSLGSTFIHLYTKVVSMFLPIPSEEQRELAADLENDAFLEHSLNSTMCILYHNFSAVIAPLTVALTTMKHCQFQKPDTPILESQQLTEIRDGEKDSLREES